MMLPRVPFQEALEDPSVFQLFSPACSQESSRTLSAAFSDFSAGIPDMPVPSLTARCQMYVQNHNLFTDDGT